MKINIAESVRKFPTFKELKQGDLFMPIGENCVYLKAKYEANGKTKAVRIADGFITDIDDITKVIPCHDAQLYIKI